MIVDAVAAGLDVHRPNLLLGVMVIHKAKIGSKTMAKPPEIPAAAPVKDKPKEEELKYKTSGSSICAILFFRCCKVLTRSFIMS